MPRQFKTSVKLLLSLLLLGSLLNTLLAQTVKKTATPQKKTITVTKKAATVKPKTTTVAKKTTGTATKTTVVKKTIPVKATNTKPLPVAELKMSSRETQMVNEINLVRSDPPGYVKFIKEYLKTAHLSKHGITVANELMDELKRLQPLGSLIVSWDMYREARDYGKLMMENNITEHSDLPYNENLSFGIENIREAIIDLLIDEEIPNRGHRRNILKKEISYIAVHELPGKVDDFQYCYIQEFK